MPPRLLIDPAPAPRRRAVRGVFRDGDGGLSAANPGAFDAALLREARADGFFGKIGETHLVSVQGVKTLLVGLGARKEADGHTLRLFGAAAYRRIAATTWPEVRISPPDGVLPTAEAVRAVAEGVGLAAYRHDAFKSKPADAPAIREIRFDAPPREAKAAGERLALARLFTEAVDFARDLINEPPSRKTPSVLGRRARALAGPRVRVTVHEKPALLKMGAGGLLGVNRGSAHPPVMVHFRYAPAGRPRRRLAFVGKGITFDSGGLSLKPADGMMTMKYDMAGAATVFGLFTVLPRLAPDVEVHGIAPITENMPGPDAYKPGDVVTALNGKTIEVLNTDAEGRVVLADALAYAARLGPDEILDVATLTGAATVALGKNVLAVMSNTPALMDRLGAAARDAGEKTWPLPLEPSYRDHIKSKVADLKNIGNPGEAGTIIGGLFLEEFVDGRPWLHVDMAGVGWNANGSPLSPPGATGAVVRTFLNHILRADGRNRP